LIELTEAGRALQPALFELLRWGARYLFPQRPGERFEPEWLRMVLEAYAATAGTPAIGVAISVRDEEGEVWPVAVVAGGEGGTSVVPFGPADAEIAATPLGVLGLMSGQAGLDELESRAEAGVSGDRAAALRFPSLFRMR
jgi:hypothetical protein